jgi:DNA-binding GntR family transcriptional regulator
MAIGELVQEGTLRREQGRRTFISWSDWIRVFSLTSKFADKDASEEIIPESKIITIENVPRLWK